MFIKRSLPPLVVAIKRVWDFAEHNAFTDMLFAFGRFYLTFREAKHHEKGANGVIRILTSNDGLTWEPKALIEEEGLDLRDPKLSVTPEGKLLLLAGSSVWDKEGKFLYMETLVAFGDENLNFSPFTKILERDQWLWRLTWHQGVGYGISYVCTKGEESALTLWETLDGIGYKKIKDFELEGKPNESTIRFMSNGAMVALVRRSEGWMTPALMGISYPPFNDWKWSSIGYQLGGPNFLVFSDNEMWVTGRLLYGSPYGLIAKTALLKNTKEGFRRELLLPSFDDTSYPGILFHDGYLWVSYYSTHEEKTAIYVAKIMIP